jgi:hypothetical protein
MNREIYPAFLKWTSDRGTAGFTMDQLKVALDADSEDMLWIQTMFTGSERLISSIGGRTDNDKNLLYYLTAAGSSAAVDYLELKQARDDSKEARKLALWAIWIGIGVGAVQIILGIVQLCYDHPVGSI